MVHLEALRGWIGIHMTAQANNRTAQRSLKSLNIVLLLGIYMKNSRNLFIMMKQQKQSDTVDKG